MSCKEKLGLDQLVGYVVIPELLLRCDCQSSAFLDLQTQWRMLGAGCGRTVSMQLSRRSRRFTKARSIGKVLGAQIACTRSGPIDPSISAVLHARSLDAHLLHIHPRICSAAVSSVTHCGTDGVGASNMIRTGSLQKAFSHCSSLSGRTSRSPACLYSIVYKHQSKLRPSCLNYGRGQD